MIADNDIVESLIDDLATALVMYNQSRITMQSLAGSVGDFLKSYHALRAADNRDAAAVPAGEAVAIPRPLPMAPRGNDQPEWDHDLENSYVQGWNDCRSAALAAHPPAAGDKVREDYAKLATEVRTHLRFRETNVPRVPSIAELRQWAEAFEALAQPQEAGRD